MPQKVAVLASVLKPVDDTRLYEKLGRTIGQTNKYRVNIIGFRSKKLPHDPEVKFHPIFDFTRYQLSRLWAPCRFYHLLEKLLPGLLVVASPELLPAASVFKLFNKIELWYDIQENYRRNVQTQPSYPSWLKPFLLIYLWAVETLCYPLVDHFLVAEKGYLYEMDLPLKKCTLLANKVWRNPSKRVTSSNGQKTFVYTGTISHEHGIMESIRLIQAFHRIDNKVRLRIVGQCRDRELYRRLIKIGDQADYIKIEAGEDPLPHAYLLEAIAAADYGLVAHRPIGSFENSIPTRIYEFLQAEIPMILQEHPLWEAVVCTYPGAITIDFQQVDPRIAWQQLQQTEFYQLKPGNEILWESEVPKLLDLLLNKT